MIFVWFKSYQKYIFYWQKIFRKCFHKKLSIAWLPSEENSILTLKLLFNNSKPDKESRRLFSSLEYSQPHGKKWLKLHLLSILSVKLLKKVKRGALLLELIWTLFQWFKPTPILNTNPNTTELPTCVVTTVIWHAYSHLFLFLWVKSAKSPKTKPPDCSSNLHNKAHTQVLNLWSNKDVSKALTKFTDAINGRQLLWVSFGANKGLSWAKLPSLKLRSLEPVDMEVSLKSSRLQFGKESTFIKRSKIILMSWNFQSKVFLFQLFPFSKLVNVLMSFLKARTWKEVSGRLKTVWKMWSVVKSRHSSKRQNQEVLLSNTINIQTHRSTAIQKPRPSMYWEWERKCLERKKWAMVNCHSRQVKTLHFSHKWNLGHFSFWVHQEDKRIHQCCTIQTSTSTINWFQREVNFGMNWHLTDWA